MRERRRAETGELLRACEHAPSGAARDGYIRILVGAMHESGASQRVVEAGVGPLLRRAVVAPVRDRRRWTPRVAAALALWLSQRRALVSPSSSTPK